MATSERMGDGGPAFPVVATTPRDVGGAGNYTTIGDVYSVGGMTLRDYFAAKAMASFCTTAHPAQQDANYIAKCAYIQADAMLAARSKS